MIKISHQFKNLSPNWDVKFLFIGTFNPEGGQTVPYFYGRDKNFCWKILSDIFKEDFNPKSKDFFQLIEKHKIACIDMIKSLQRNDNRVFQEDQLYDIIGKGYSDSKIINRSIKREYNIKEIQKIVSLNNCNVYSTWGKGSSLNEWKDEVKKILFTANLVSPSPVARVPKGESKYTYVLNDWRSKIIL